MDVISTDAQVRRLMEEHGKHGRVGLSAMRSGMHRNTAARYLSLGRLPSEMRIGRSWRTREDPFAEDWPELEAKLELAPELEARALFEDLLERAPGRYHAGQVRTLQRRVRAWRAQHGPPKEVYFAQQHRPGEAMQTDFTWMTSLGITIAGEAYPHMLCHQVLPYSNWEWGTVCFSESMMALRRGVQSAIFRLGRVPRFHQTDNSTAATHDLATGKREFNQEYQALMRHLGMEPRTIAVGEKQQNGDIEAANGAVKRRLEQHLLLRGSRDFTDEATYERWLGCAFEKANALRRQRLAQELLEMRPLVVERLAECSEERVRVTSWSTISVKRNTYSVPSRLIGEEVVVLVYEDKLDVTYGGTSQLVVSRLRGEGKRSINYRHVIHSLVRKPGAFERYRFREELFPSLTFRRAFDVLAEALSPRRSDIEYLRLLELAATTMECEVEAAIAVLLSEGVLPIADRVASAVAPRKTEVPLLPRLVVDLAVYDRLVGVRS